MSLTPEQVEEYQKLKADAIKRSQNQLVYAKKYYSKVKDDPEFIKKRKEISKTYYEKNKAAILERDSIRKKEYYKKNKETIKAIRNAKYVPKKKTFSILSDLGVEQV
jgi:hypothetical protein